MRDIDRSIFKYADTVAVTSGTTWTGDPVLLYGAMAMSVQCVTTNGAAGTLYIDGTNQDGNNGSYMMGASNVVLSANGQSIMNFSLTDAVLTMRSVRLRFVPSASGNLRIDINLRRINQ